MSKMEYMPVDCLQVPKMLFQVEEFKNLSNTAWGRSGSTGTGGDWKSGAHHSEQWKGEPLLYQ